MVSLGGRRSASLPGCATVCAWASYTSEANEWQILQTAVAAGAARAGEAGRALAESRPRVPLAGRYATLCPEPTAPLQKPVGARGLPKSFRFHDLRHTCATLLLRQGVNPKFVQELLGQADISLILNVYSHVLPDMGNAAAGAMDDALG